MLLFWAAYALLYVTALQWSHLNVLGSSYIRSIPVRLGRRPAIEASRFFLSAGLPLANTSATPISIEIPSSTPTPTPPAPTSSRIPIPGTIIFPASPLPTARLPHQALPLCYDGLHDDLPPATGSRTVTGITTDLIADGPGLFMRYFLVTSALASTLIDNLVRSPACCALICVLALVWVSCVLFVMRRGAFKAAAGCTRAARHCSCSRGRDSNVRVVVDSKALVTAPSTLNNASSTSPPFPSPSKKPATMGPALTKTGRLIARKKRNRVRKQTPVKSNSTPATPQNNYTRNNSPPYNPSRNDSPPEPVETDTRVWSVNGSSTIEYTPSVRRCKKRASPVGNGLAALD